MSAPDNKLISRLQNMVFVLLFIVVIGLLGWISERHVFDIDLTAGQRNSLSEASINVITRLDKPLSITAFVRDSSKGARDRIKALIELYHQHKADIDFKILNPDLVPELVREQGITVDGELVISYNKRQENLKSANERDLTQLLMRLANNEENFIVFTEGHGERNPLGNANHDLGEFGQRLSNQGFNIQLVNLAKSLAIPDNARVLAIASPRTRFLPGEIKLIEDYLEKGGNLIWFTEPGQEDGLEELEALLGIKRLPGVVVDATTQLFGITDPTFALVIDYPPHKITEQLHSQTLFPKAAGLITAEQSDWQGTPILTTLERSWTETGAIEGDIRFDPDSEEKAGPITIGLALESARAATESDEEPGTPQRVVVLGDGDFVSNTYAGNGQNLDMASALIKWLSHDEQFIDIGIVSAPDTRLDISQTGAIALFAIFLLLLPLGLLVSGIAIWLKRRNS